MKREIYTAAAGERHVRMICLRPRGQSGPLPGILWIHGGGYSSGMAAMVYVSDGLLLAKRFGAVVLSPEYTRSGKAPYPAALEDCCAALRYLWDNAETLGVRRDRIIVGGESAGGGLTAAVCLWARDQGHIPVAAQLPLYPMLDCRDTSSSRNNHGIGWDTRRNHKAWKQYLGALSGSDAVPKYASPARETDYSGLPPCYTFVCDGEPFYDETLTYVRNLRSAGVDAAVDVYQGKVHAFDLLRFWTKQAAAAREKLCAACGKWLT